MNAKKFKNFTDKEFTWKFNGIPYTFAAGSDMYLEEDKADHFAKHLVDQVLNEQNMVTNNMSEREKYTKMCFPSDEVVTSLEALQVTEKAKKGKKKVEEEFADLKK